MITIIYSFKNENKNIQTLIDRTIKTCKKINKTFEIIFVDDASTDNSSEIIKLNIKERSNIKYIRMTRTFGVGPCISAGLKFSSGELVVYLDADLQDPPELIYEMYNKSLEGFDVIHTKRRIRKGENFFKLLLTKFAYYLLHKTLNVKIEKNSGDFKLLKRKVVNAVLNLGEKDPFLRALPNWTGYKNHTILYDREPRYGGETKFSLLKSLNPYKEIIRAVTSFSSFPLYFGIVFTIIGIIILILLFIFDFILNFFKINPMIYLIIFLFTFLQFSIGSIGIYIERILKYSNNRPEYIIEEVEGFQNNVL